VAAAPHLFDDPPIASPELALVDSDLAEQLRADMPSSEAFRPRDVARPAYLSLIFDVDAPEPAQDELPPVPVDEHDELPADVVELVPAYVVVAGDEHVDDVALDDHDAPDVAQSFDEPVPRALVEPTDELPDYIVARDEATVDVVPVDVLPVDDVVAYVAESFDEPVSPALDEPADALADYVVRADDTVVDVVPEDVLPSDGLVLDEEVAEYIPEGIVLPVLPTVEEPADALPDYIVRDDQPVVDVVPEYVVLADDVREDDGLPNDGEASADHAQSRSKYPLLPDLDERSDALEETEAALRKIRENMGVPPTAQRKRRVRRRFTVATGLCAVTALAVYAAEVELGVAHAPGWLSL
jgi:hypothetical protein